MNLFRNATDTTQFESGATICREGDPGDCMYAIVDGQVAIATGGRVIEVLGPGDVFGEMSLIEHSPRTATATAKTACSIAIIDERRFGYMVQPTPYFALEMLRTLSVRLRRLMRSEN